MATNDEGTHPDGHDPKDGDLERAVPEGQEAEPSPEGELRAWEAHEDTPAPVEESTGQREDSLGPDEDQASAPAPAETAAGGQPPPYVPPAPPQPEPQPQPQPQPQTSPEPAPAEATQPGWPPASPTGDEQPAADSQPWDQQGQQAPTSQQPTPQQSGPPAASWTVPGSPPTAQQPVVDAAAAPPVVGQPLGQQPYQQQPQQQYQQPQQQYQQPYGAPEQAGAPTGPTRGGGPMAFLGGLLLLLGGAALIVGSFLDWGEAGVAGQTITLTGFKNAQDNIWGAPGTLAAGGVLIIAGLMYFVSFKGGVGGLKRALALLGSLGALGWVVYLLVSLELDKANALVGLWLCLAGAVIGLLGTFLGRGKKQAALPKS